MGNSPTVQWLEPSTLTAKSLGSILGWGTKKSHKSCSVVWKKKKENELFVKWSKNGH